jgi:hypothetical protein
MCPSACVIEFSRLKAEAEGQLIFAMNLTLTAKSANKVEIRRPVRKWGRIRAGLRHRQTATEVRPWRGKFFSRSLWSHALFPTPVKSDRLPEEDGRNLVPRGRTSRSVLPVVEASQRIHPGRYSRRSGPGATVCSGCKILCSLKLPQSMNSPAYWNTR